MNLSEIVLLSVSTNFLESLKYLPIDEKYEFTASQYEYFLKSLEYLPLDKKYELSEKYVKVITNRHPLVFTEGSAFFFTIFTATNCFCIWKQQQNAYIIAGLRIRVGVDRIRVGIDRIWAEIDRIRFEILNLTRSSLKLLGPGLKLT